MGASTASGVSGGARSRRISVAVVGTSVRKVSAGKNGAASAKVVSLAEAAQELKGGPTPLQQEALVLKYRTKARKLGRSILRGWHARLDLEEVDSIVDLSLCEAVRRFNPFKGASFMTFLFYHLKGNLIRAVANAAASHTIPLFAQDAEAVERGEREHFCGHQLRGLSSNEVADALTSEDVPLPDEVVWRKQLTSKSSSACEKLDELEREIIKRLFVQEQQIMEIAATLGYSRCHISRVKKKALETLHQELKEAVNAEDLGIAAEPQASTEEDEDSRCVSMAERRPVFRRKPRSKVSQSMRQLKACAA